MDPVSILTVEDCERERTPEEFLAWIDSIAAKFRNNDKTIKTCIRSDKKLTKKFFEEMRPLGDLARHKYMRIPGVYLRPRTGDQNCDAEVIDRSSTPVKVRRIEFGSAYRDRDLALRWEYLTKHGGVPMTGSVKREGTKASGGEIKVQSNCAKHEDLLEKQFRQIDELVSNKLSRTYDAATILVVVLDDYLAFDLDKDLPQLEGFLREKVVASVLAKFSGLVVIGASGQTFLEFGNTRL